MNTLFIYDTSGHIISNGQGDVYVPVGVPSMWVEVPQGKRVTSFKTTMTPHKPIFEDIPKTETELVREDINNLNIQVAESKAKSIMALEAAAAVYEALLPFLP